MNRSMGLSVGVLVILGAIVAFHIAREDSPAGVAPAPGVGDAPVLRQSGPVAGPAARPEAGAQSPAAGEAAAAPKPVAPRVNEPAGPASAWKLPLEVCERRIAAGEIGAALRELGHRYRQSRDAAARSFWREPLLGWAAEFLHGPSLKDPHAGMYDRYVVQSGDLLVRIAARLRRDQQILVEPTFLQDVNRIADPTRLRAGQTIYLPNVNPSVVITLGEFRLDLFLGDCLFESFPVGVGKDDGTPAVDFTVGEKLEEPDWYFAGRKIPYGHPDHELGERWIGFVHETHQGYGIHGTHDDRTIGKAVSRGCIRLRNADVLKVYRWLPKGALVTVRP